MKHSLSDNDITTELSSRRKFLRGMAVASAGVGLAALGVTAASAADHQDYKSRDCSDGGADSSGPDSGACTSQQ